MRLPINPPANILIVDDDEEITDLLTAYLASFGYVTHAAGDGAAMRAQLARHAVDLLVLDVMLPGSDGLTLAREVRANSALPIIMLTARGNIFDRVIGLENGADNYMAKPFEPRELVARVQTQLEQRDLLIAAVSHDLRTPLTRLALRAEGLANTQLRDGLGRDIREMDEMIRCTLDYLCGAADAEPAVALDMVALLQSMAADAQEVGQDVQFDADAPVSCRPVRVQVSSIRRCIANLIDNAVRYGTSARIRLIVLPQTLRIQVQDQGPGLAPDELAKVLAPFYRVDASRSRRHGGVGLGLAIADEISRRHRGELQLTNAPVGGLIATLVLPG